MLTAITLLAGLLRFHELGEWAFWVDEAHTYRDVLTPSAAFWDSNVSYYPLSYLLLRTLTGLGMGGSEGWLRLPFAFFGVLSVPALGLVGRSLVGRRAALVAALLLAVSPWHIFWSQNARSYAMVLFFTLVAAGVYFRGFQRGSLRWVMVGVALTLVAGLCHPSAYFMLFAYAAHGLWPRAAATTSPIPPVVQAAFDGERRLHRWLPLGGVVLFGVVALLLAPLIEQFRISKPDFSVSHLLQTVVFYVNIPLLVAALGGLLLMLDQRQRAAPFLASWLVVPVLVLAVIGATILQVTAQYAFFTLPVFCLLGAYFAVGVAERIVAASWTGQLLRVVPLCILLFDLAGQSFLYFVRYHGDRPLWRAASDFVVAAGGDQKRVVTTNAPSMAYYLHREALTDALAPGPTQVVGLARFQFKQATGMGPLQELVERARTEPQVELYVVVTEPELAQMDPSGVADAYLRANLKQVRRLRNTNGPKDMTVLVYYLER